MFFATALLYPCVLVALCVGAGLALDRAAGGFLPGSLLVSCGAATLIALSQLSTYLSALAPATPYAMAALALAGLWLGRGRARALLGGARASAPLLIAAVLTYAIALAPVLAAGRASFSSYMALADSAVHMIGADYLIRHGQQFAHLDLRNSYGLVLGNYYNSNYPSGADTLFGGSALLLRLPLIWAFQPFNAFLLASAVGPAWLLARRLGLRGAWAALAALSAVTPALVYAYELFGSIKELAALSMILTLGALVASHRRWLRGPPNRALPFALVLAAGASALGPAFGAWGLASVAVLAAILAGEMRARRVRVAPTLALAGCAALALLLAAWPTWHKLSGSLRVAQAIASTGNAGNLRAPLRASQAFGVWLGSSYKLAPAGAWLGATHVLIALTFLAALLGAARLLRTRAWALAGWVAAMLLVWLVLTLAVSTWASAKTLMLSSPVVVLLAWGGVAALRALPLRPRVASTAAALLALALAGGVLVSDAMQSHGSNLAPTARYDELATIDARFAGQGPTLLTDFDEWALYELRDMDVGGPDFAYPPPALAAAAGGYGHPVDLNRASPAALRSYPLILTRRDPRAARPPAAYAVVWRGSYYELWRRARGAPAALAHVALTGVSAAAQCARIGRLAGRGTGTSFPPARLIAARAPEVVSVALAASTHPRDWGRERAGLVMRHAGSLRASFRVPAAGRWRVWVQGQIMPTVALGVDGERVASIGGLLGGNSLVFAAAPPVTVSLAAGAHRLTLTRAGGGVAPGDGGSAVLDAIFLTPAGAGDTASLREAPVARWRTLCGGRYEWVELLGV